MVKLKLCYSLTLLMEDLILIKRDVFNVRTGYKNRILKYQLPNQKLNAVNLYKLDLMQWLTTQHCFIMNPMMLLCKLIIQEIGKHSLSILQMKINAHYLTVPSSTVAHQDKISQVIHKLKLTEQETLDCLSTQKIRITNGKKAYVTLAQINLGKQLNLKT